MYSWEVRVCISILFQSLKILAQITRHRQESQAFLGYSASKLKVMDTLCPILCFLWCPALQYASIFISFPSSSLSFWDYPLHLIFDPQSFSHLCLKFTSRRKFKQHLRHFQILLDFEKWVTLVLCGLGLSQMTSLTLVLRFHSCVGEPQTTALKMKLTFLRSIFTFVAFHTVSMHPGLTWRS